jgi:glucosylceramidase
MKLLSGITVISLLFSCAITNNKHQESVDFYLTKADASATLEQQIPLYFDKVPNDFSQIKVDAQKTFQTIKGFGYTLTGGSAALINSLTAGKKQALLQELFGDNENSISISYLRISIGTSDLNASVFSYNDLIEGQTDTAQVHFSLEKDLELIQMLEEIIKIQPNIKIMAVPWSAPAWMKDDFTTKGSSLSRKYYESYALYFVKYIQEMQKRGIAIESICIQNEPLNGDNNPSMVMLAQEQADFIKFHLGPYFEKEKIKTKIVLYDHNCDVPNYPISILDDQEANPYIDGSAFHLYGGTIEALSEVHDAHPSKNIYFTEQWTSSQGDFSGDLNWHTKNVMIGSMRNWSQTALEWNLANDATFNPHTVGGCTQCKGAITIDGPTSFTRNVAYYTIAHASKFIPSGSVRIESNTSELLPNVAFITPDGKKVVLVENNSSSLLRFNIKENNQWITLSLDTGSVATLIWE